MVGKSTVQLSTRHPGQQKHSSFWSSQAAWHASASPALFGGERKLCPGGALRQCCKHQHNRRALLYCYSSPFCGQRISKPSCSTALCVLWQHRAASLGHGLRRLPRTCWCLGQAWSCSQLLQEKSPSFCFTNCSVPGQHHRSAHFSGLPEDTWQVLCQQKTIVGHWQVGLEVQEEKYQYSIVCWICETVKLLSSSDLAQ